MVYTKEEFKRLWESDSHGGGITNDDCADCAKAWGVASMPRCMRIDLLVYLVCQAANISKEEMPCDPYNDEEDELW